ncbi:MAG TPA: Hsp20/alpha crystallin family protein [Nitrospiraceae bacterium]|jgi:HSP20 family protein|nr:Hsp20/alpha crystallin family protein [Nitrospiraceae bacterium]
MTLVPYVSNLMRLPFESQIDRLFEEAVRGVTSRVSAWIPSCNVYEDDHAFYVQAVLPGMDAKDLDILVEDGMLTVKGERKGPAPEAGQASWLVHEIAEGSFARTFVIPSYVDHSQAKASYKEGILTVTFPKKEEAKPRRILIEECK